MNRWIWGYRVRRCRSTPFANLAIVLFHDVNIGGEGRGASRLERKALRMPNLRGRLIPDLFARSLTGLGYFSSIP